MTTLNLFTNRATAKLAADVSSADTALTLVPGGGDWFPNPAANQFFRLVLQKGTSQTDQREYMVCTSRAGDVLTVTRAQEGTPAANFTAGDEVSLVATALTLTSLVQRVGATLQGALEVEADPTTPLGIATKAFVEAGRVNDVPDDGNTYGRMFGAWMALGAAAGLAVPIPVAAGGTGGVTVAEAQTNLYIPTTTFDDLEPATKKYGDRWIKPSNMVEMVWAPNAGGGGAGIWINPADATSQAYPIPITHGGTGATTAAQARINLGITNAANQFILGNGTAAVPSLAFVNEPGLGWFRQGPGVVCTTFGGAITSYIAATDIATAMQLTPKTAGSAIFYLGGQPNGAANQNTLVLSAQATGYAISELKTGTATAKPLRFASFQYISMDVPTLQVGSGGMGSAGIDIIAASGEAAISYVRGATKRWYMTMAGTPGDSWALARCNASGAYLNSPINVAWDTGNIQFAGAASFNSAVTFGGQISGSTMYLSGNANIGSINSPNAVAANTFSAAAATGLVVNGVADWGGGNIGQVLLQGNPSWNALYLQALHVQGQWAGFRMATAAGGMGVVDFVMSGSSSEVRAGTFTGNLNGSANKVNGIKLNWTETGTKFYVWTASTMDDSSLVQTRKFCTAITDHNIRFGWTGASLISDVDGYQFTVYPQNSERHLKQEIAPSRQDALALINRVPFREFRYKPRELVPDDRLHPCGVIIDEIEDIAPDWVDPIGEGKAPNTYFMLMSAMRAIQQLSARINQLEKA